MKFGPVAVGDAVGAIAAHSVRGPGVMLKKGAVVDAATAAALASAGVAEIVAARLQSGDIGEDAAALRLAQGLVGHGIRIADPFTGRSNLFADTHGLLIVDAPAIDRVNAVDEAITVATLAPYAVVTPGEMAGTVKIIPYAVAGRLLDVALTAAGGAPVLSVAPFRAKRVSVISTLLPGLKPSVVTKTLAVLDARLAPFGSAVSAHRETPHETGALAAALGAEAAGEADILVVFGASAITDRRDVIPAAIAAAGGRVEHLGMPVDPGNLLLIGELAGKPVIGAPGCARSPKENGFDWVLQRLLAERPARGADIMGMGVGGLLMEIVTRPQPREGEAGA